MSILQYRRTISNKGQFGLFGLMVILQLFIVISVILFLLFFQYHITLYVNDQIDWNKYQEVPLSFISASPDGKYLTAEASKVFNGFISPDDFRNEIKEFPQLFDDCYIFNVTNGKKYIDWQDTTSGCNLDERIFQITYPYPVSFNPDSLTANMTTIIFPVQSSQAQNRQGPNSH